MVEETNADASANATAITRAGGDERTTTGGKTAEEKVTFDLLRSALYHDFRDRHLSRVNKIIIFLTIILSSGAVAAFGASFPIYGQAAGVVIAALGAVSIVWDFGGQASLHRDLKRRFYTLLSEAERGACVTDLRSASTLIYGDEPPIHNRDNRRAHNQAGETLFAEDFERVRVWRFR